MELISYIKFYGAIKEITGLTIVFKRLSDKIFLTKFYNQRSRANDKPYNESKKLMLIVCC